VPARNITAYRYYQYISTQPSAVQHLRCCYLIYKESIMNLLKLIEIAREERISNNISKALSRRTSTCLTHNEIVRRKSKNPKIHINHSANSRRKQPNETR
jgi:hypothetical protein